MIGWIGLGGIGGALSRYYLGRLITAKIGSTFPWATLLVNSSGSLWLGMLYGWHGQYVIADWAWWLFGIGFCGAYTTFSTFGWETVQLIERRRFAQAIVYVGLSVAVGLLAAWLGLRLVS